MTESISKIYSIITFSLTLILAMSFSQSHAVGTLGTPNKNQKVSGVGVISGYHCTSNNIDVYMDGVHLGKAGAGTKLLGTVDTCGKAETGFSLLYNFNNLNEGTHTIEVYADNVRFDSTTFTSFRSGGVPWLSGKSKRSWISDFPEPGKTAIVEWSQSNQNFLINKIIDTSKLDGTYYIYRFSLQDTDGNIIDSEQNNVSVSGTMTINGRNMAQKVTLNILGTSIPVSVNDTFVDNGYYVSTPSSNIVIPERGITLMTSLLAYEPTLGYLNEIDYWVRSEFIE